MRRHGPGGGGAAHVQRDVEESASHPAANRVEHAAEARGVGVGGGELRGLRDATHAVAARVRTRVAAERLGAHAARLAVLLAA